MSTGTASHSSTIAPTRVGAFLAWCAERGENPGETRALHALLRKLASSAFTPRRMSEMDGAIRRATRDIVAAVAEPGTPFDFVGDVAEPLPIWAICEIFGLDEPDRKWILPHANAMTGCRDPE
ncbi:MAG TPA: hypothetical protein VN408_15170 [Actinoplanes sp.]|nr:hypothetical protein [Actinoplanes sp.]